MLRKLQICSLKNRRLLFARLCRGLNCQYQELQFKELSGKNLNYNKYSNLKSFKEVPFSPALNIIMLKEKGSSVIFKSMLNTDQEITGFKRLSNKCIRFHCKRNRCEDGPVQLVKYNRNSKQSVLV